LHKSQASTKDRGVCRGEFIGGVLLIGTDQASVSGYAARSCRWVSCQFHGRSSLSRLCGVSGDPAKDIGEPCLGIDVVELGGADEGIHGCGASAAAVEAGERPRFAAEGDRAFILPISGRIASFTTAGTHCSVGVYALKLSNSVQTASWPPSR